MFFRQVSGVVIVQNSLVTLQHYLFIRVQYRPLRSRDCFILSLAGTRLLGASAPNHHCVNVLCPNRFLTAFRDTEVIVGWHAPGLYFTHGHV